MAYWVNKPASRLWSFLYTYKGKSLIAVNGPHLRPYIVWRLYGLLSLTGFCSHRRKIWSWGLNRVFSAAAKHCSPPSPYTAMCVCGGGIDWELGKQGLFWCSSWRGMRDVTRWEIAKELLNHLSDPQLANPSDASKLREEQAHQN